MGGLEMLQRILRERRMRVRLWSEGCELFGQPDEQSTVNSLDSIIEETRLKPASEIFSTRRSAPAWMITRELRDTSYLVEFMRQCRGSGADEWDAALSLARKEILPPRRGHAVSVHSPPIPLTGEDEASSQMTLKEKRKAHRIRNPKNSDLTHAARLRRFARKQRMI